MPTNSILTIHNQTVTVHPIADKYGNRSPHQTRSATYVQTKGLAANEKTGATRAGTPVATPNADLDAHKRFLGPVIPFAPRTRAPEPSVRTRATKPHSSSEPPDVRSLTAPPIIRSSQPPAQGNIKKKRASLSALEAANGVGDANPPPLPTPPFPLDQEPNSPLTPEPPRNEYGNPQKITQFFPELKISQ